MRACLRGVRQRPDRLPLVASRAEREPVLQSSIHSLGEGRASVCLPQQGGGPACRHLLCWFSAASCRCSQSSINDTMATHVTHTPGSCAVEVEKTAQKEFGLRTRKPQEQPTFHALQRDVSRGQHVETTVEMKRKRSGGSSWAQRLSWFSLFYCLLSALLLLPSASDAIESSWILKLDAPDDLNRQAVQGEPFLVQPRLTLRNPTNPVYNQPGIRVEAHCVTSGCVVDCAKKIMLPGNCSALTDALGQVHFSFFISSSFDHRLQPCVRVP